MSDNIEVKIYLKSCDKVGKYTVIDGIDSDTYNLSKLARALSGAIKAPQRKVNEEKSRMCFQGDHVERIRQFLDAWGFI